MIFENSLNFKFYKIENKSRNTIFEWGIIRVYSQYKSTDFQAFST